VLAAVAALLVWLGWGGDAGPSAVGWIGALSAFQLLVLIGGLVLLGLLAGQGWFLLHLLRQNGRLLVRVEAFEDSFGSGDATAPYLNAAASQPAAGLPIGTTAQLREGSPRRRCRPAARTRGQEDR
jgi:hypothetical protein